MEKKVVILINGLSNGGAERVCSILLNDFIDKYKCYVILIHNDDIFYKLDVRINIIQLKEKKYSLGFVKMVRLPIIAYKLSKIIIENNFLLVTSFLTRSNYINILASFISKHKSIISERSMPSIQYQYGINGAINKFLIRKLYPFAYLCLSNSYGNKLDLIDNFKVDNVVCIQNPLNQGAVGRLSEENIEINQQRFTFVTVGRLDYGKNHRLIIDAIYNIGADLWIIGDGELRDELENYIKFRKLSKRVHLLGKKENPFAYISKANCFVFASNHEGFPNVLLEALACGLPIISTDCQSGPREILAPNSDVKYQLKDKVEFAEYGILTPIKNVVKLQEAMNMIVNDEDLRKTYQDKAKLRANDFRIDKIIKQYEEIICVE